MRYKNSKLSDIKENMIRREQNVFFDIFFASYVLLRKQYIFNDIIQNIIYNIKN